MIFEFHSIKHQLLQLWCKTYTNVHVFRNNLEQYELGQPIDGQVQFIWVDLNIYYYLFWKLVVVPTYRSLKWISSATFNGRHAWLPVCFVLYRHHSDITWNVFKVTLHSIQPIHCFRFIHSLVKESRILSNLLRCSFVTAGRSSRTTLHRFKSSLSMSDYKVLFVLGGPGAGKGTQCEKIVNVSIVTYILWNYV